MTLCVLCSCFCVRRTLALQMCGRGPEGCPARGEAGSMAPSRPTPGAPGANSCLWAAGLGGPSFRCCTVVLPVCGWHVLLSNKVGASSQTRFHRQCCRSRSGAPVDASSASCPPPGDFPLLLSPTFGSAVRLGLEGRLHCVCAVPSPAALGPRLPGRDTYRGDHNDQILLSLKLLH